MPNTVGRNYDLKSALAPLGALKSEVSVVSGLKIPWAAENAGVIPAGGRRDGFHVSTKLVRLVKQARYRVVVDHDFAGVIDACAATGTWIELNANPWRFDLDWRLWPYAKSKGVKCVINCDAHRLQHAGFLRLGAGIAR